MVITRIEVKRHEYDSDIMYQDYFEGPKMSNDIRHEIRNEIELWRKGKSAHTNITAVVFHTMCKLGYHRIDAEHENFIIIF